MADKNSINLGRVLPIYKGDWNADTNYDILDIVYYNGNSYTAKQPSTNQEPKADSAYWGLSSVKGQKGDQGPKGDRGATGPAGKDAEMPVIGGRNYVLNSSGLNGSTIVRPTLIGSTSAVYNATSSYPSDGILLTNGATNTTAEWFYQVATSWTNFSDTPLTPGKPITFSVDVMGTVPQAVLRYGFNGTGGKESFKAFDINNTSWTRVSITVTSTSTNTGLYFRIQGGIDNQYSNGFAGGETLKFRYVKIEAGNVATDWTPAPEDIDSTYLKKSQLLPAEARDFNYLATHMKTYQGTWYNRNEIVANAPTNNWTWSVIEVIAGNADTTGTIRTSRFSSSNTYSANVSGGAIQRWSLIADDAQLVHKTGNETIAGDKTFIGNTKFSGGVKGGQNILSSSGDLNDLTETGKYYQTKTADAVNWKNRPVNAPNLAFSVDVIGQANRSLATQVYYVHTTSRMWIRTMWLEGSMHASEWTELANDTNVVHNTGDETIAGNKIIMGDNTYMGTNTFMDGVSLNGKNEVNGLTDTDWLDIPLAAGRTGTAKYKVSLGKVVVHLDGVKGVTATGNNAQGQIGTLPVNPNTYYARYNCQSGSVTKGITINSNGVIYVANSMGNPMSEDDPYFFDTVLM